jgi:hypothetical protein
VAGGDEGVVSDEGIRMVDGGGVGRLGRGRVRDVSRLLGDALRLATRDGELSREDG